MKKTAKFSKKIELKNKTIIILSMKLIGKHNFKSHDSLGWPVKKGFY